MILSPSLEEAIIGYLIDEGKVTRQQLITHLKIRPATLFEAVIKLEKSGILHEPDRKGIKTGRKASSISFNKDYLSFIGVELNVNRIVCTCLDTEGGQYALTTMNLDSREGASEAQGKVEKAIDDAVRVTETRNLRIGGIGFADPGLVDTANGIGLKAVNIPGWENLGITKWLSEKYQTFCLAFPAPTARAYAEYIAQGKPSSLFHMELGPTLGGGFVKDGNLFIGDSFAAMEIGHVVVENEGPLCRCGNRGCLEAVASLSGIRRRISELISRGVQTSLKTSEIDYPEFMESVRNLDKPAYSLAQEIAEKIGVGLASLVAILNPKVIVMSGGLAGLDDILLSVVRNVLAMRCLSISVANLELKVSSLDDSATASGAAQLVRRKVLSEAVRKIAGKN